MRFLDKMLEKYGISDDELIIASLIFIWSVAIPVAIDTFWL